MLKNTAAILAFTAFFVAAFVYFNQPDEVITSEIVESLQTTPGVATKRETPGTTSTTALSYAQAEIQALVEKTPEVLRTLANGIGNFTDAQIEEYNKYAVIPFNRAIGQLCEEDPKYWNGEIYKSASCKTQYERTHPYTEESTDQLRELAMTNAEAALILGRRVPKEEIEWHLRAAVLSQKSGPIMHLAWKRSLSTERLVRVKGGFERKPMIDKFIEGYALETLAERLGDPRADSSRWVSLLEMHGTDEQRAQANALLDEYTSLMSAIEEQTGAVWVRGVQS